MTAQTWADWVALRKAKKAPITPTVIETAVKEAAKASLTLEDFLKVWVYRGHHGFYADWIKPADRAFVAAPKRSSHSGFANVDYSKGVTEDGHLA